MIMVVVVCGFQYIRDQLRRRNKKIMLIDVRGHQELRILGKIRGAYHIPCKLYYSVMILFIFPVCKI